MRLLVGRYLFRDRVFFPRTFIFGKNQCCSDHSALSENVPLGEREPERPERRGTGYRLQPGYMHLKLVVGCEFLRHARTTATVSDNL